MNQRPQIHLHCGSDLRRAEPVRALEETNHSPFLSCLPFPASPSPFILWAVDGRSLVHFRRACMFSLSFFFSSLHNLGMDGISHDLFYLSGGIGGRLFLDFWEAGLWGRLGWAGLGHGWQSGGEGIFGWRAACEMKWIFMCSLDTQARNIHFRFGEG